MTAAYNRTGLISFFELSAQQQADVINDAPDILAASQDTYVMFDEKDGTETALPLSSFMRAPIGNTGHYKGVYGTSYFSAYVLYVSKRGSEAVISYQHF